MNLTDAIAVRLGTGRVTHATMPGTEHKPFTQMSGKDIRCGRWSKSGDVDVIDGPVTCKSCASILEDEAAYAVVTQQSLWKIANRLWQETGIPHCVASDAQQIIRATWNCATCGPRDKAMCGTCYRLDDNGQRITDTPAPVSRGQAQRPGEDGPIRFRASNGKRKASRNHRRGW